MSVEFHPDGSKLVSETRDGEVRIWDLNADDAIRHARDLIGENPWGELVESFGQN